MIANLSEQNITLRKVFKAESGNPIDYVLLSKTEQTINFGLEHAYMFLLLEKTTINDIVQDARIYLNTSGQKQSIQLTEDDTAHLLTINNVFVEIFMSNSCIVQTEMTNYIVFPNLPDLYQLLLVDFSLLGKELSADIKNQKAIQLRARLILRMIDDLISKGTAVENSILPQPLINLNKLVNQNFILHKNASFYAKELRISPGHLTVLCRKYLGKTTKEFIDQRVIQEAKSLLKHSNFTIKEITFKLGFNCMASFSHYLKSKTGLTSKQIRNST